MEGQLHEVIKKPGFFKHPTLDPESTVTVTSRGRGCGEEVGKNTFLTFEEASHKALPFPSAHIPLYGTQTNGQTQPEDSLSEVVSVSAVRTASPVT